MSRPGTFQKGNKAAVGSGGPKGRDKFLTQALISQLNEIDKNTGREKIHRLVAELLRHALGYEYKEGKTTIRVPSELAAIKEVFDRVEGRAVQSVGVDTGAGKVTLVFEPGEEKL